MTIRSPFKHSPTPDIKVHPFPPSLPPTSYSKRTNRMNNNKEGKESERKKTGKSFLEKEKKERRKKREHGEVDSARSPEQRKRNFLASTSLDFVVTHCCSGTQIAELLPIEIVKDQWNGQRAGACGQGFITHSEFRWSNTEPLIEYLIITSTEQRRSV
ncbi:hypothetical protein NPIL_409251 [Nephila pilipes]|uniref:Uncharacterized protein n=1 Tax=Nephila pilipes TaxID=299642 RepID=A0A8X6UKN8_NEPPI|nr:hypothetical protein NPIL_409251 [Nephila pilipes]